MTRPKPQGYLWRQEITRAVNANKAIRRALARIVEDQPTGQMLMLLIARAANALGENLEALRELEHIQDDGSEMDKNGSE